MQIYLDMDGVCTDFVGAALELQIPDGSKTKADWPMGVRDAFGIASSEFWQRVEAKGEGWWYRLDELRHYRPMMRTLRSFGRVTYLTSPPWGKAGTDAVAGKLAWLQKREGADFRDFIFTYHKHLLARQDAVLIDDHIRNCTEFEQNGGSAILFPQRWNGFEELDSHAVVEYLAKCLMRIKQSSCRIMTPREAAEL